MAEGPQQIPGRVECAYYDLGGEGVAYHDTDPTNLRQWRTELETRTPPAARQSIRDEGLIIVFAVWKQIGARIFGTFVTDLMKFLPPLLV